MRRSDSKKDSTMAIPVKEMSLTSKSKIKMLLENAQFHGARHLVGDHRWMWAAALLFLLYGSMSVQQQLVERYLDKPTYLVKLSSEQDVKAFPAVVICPEIRFPEHRKDYFMSNIKIPAGMNRVNIRGWLQQLSAFFALDVPYSTRDLQRLQRLLDYNDLEVEAALLQLTRPCGETLLRCRWNGVQVNCSKLFQLEVTGDGFCCTFNGRSLRREVKEFGLHQSKDPPPLYTREVGPSNALMVLVDNSQRTDNVDLSYKWLALQTSNQYVDVSLNGTALSPGFEHWFGYLTRGFQLTDDAKQLSPRLRKCRLQNAEPPQYFPTYSRTYCNLECEMMQSFRRCGCLRPNHPLVPGRTHCKASSLQCSRHAAVSASAEKYCNCPQSCDVETILIERKSFPLFQTNYMNDFYDGIKNWNNISVVRVFVARHVRKSFARMPLFNYYDLVSQFGGIFGVYLGCSILTFLDIVMILGHLCLARLISLFKNNKKQLTNDGKSFAERNNKPIIENFPARKNRRKNKAILVQPSGFKINNGLKKVILDNSKTDRSFRAAVN